jgi:hypothetical protein
MTNNLPPTNLYEQDFYAWTQQQAECLRSGQWQQLDIENLVEEIESMGKREKRYLEDHLGILIGYLLQWHYQPKGRSKIWWATIWGERREVQQILKENPSLNPYLSEAISIAYADGVSLIERETDVPLDSTPVTCPFSEFEILREPIEWEFMQA